MPAALRYVEFIVNKNSAGGQLLRLHLQVADWPNSCRPATSTTKLRVEFNSDKIIEDLSSGCGVVLRPVGFYADPGMTELSADDTTDAFVKKFTQDSAMLRR